MTLKINIYNLIVCRVYKKCERSESLLTLFKSQIICTDDNACENIQISNETCVSHSCLQAERNRTFQFGSTKIRKQVVQYVLIVPSVSPPALPQN